MFRQLYSEKQVVAEERRARVDNSPMGPFLVRSWHLHRLAGPAYCPACLLSHLCCVQESFTQV